MRSDQLIKRCLPIIAILAQCSLILQAQNKRPYSQRMTQTVMTIWKDSLTTGDKWTYDQGVILKGIEGVWQQTGDKRYFTYI